MYAEIEHQLIITQRRATARFPQSLATALGLSSKSLRFKKRKQEEQAEAGGEGGSGPFNGRHFAPVEVTVSPPLFLAHLPFCFFILFLSPSHPHPLPFSPFLLVWSLTLVLKAILQPPGPTQGYQQKCHRTFFSPTRFHSIWRLGNCFSIAASLCRRPPLFPMHMTVSKKDTLYAPATTSYAYFPGPFIVRHRDNPPRLPSRSSAFSV